jgi:hypothetical protein
MTANVIVDAGLCFNGRHRMVEGSWSWVQRPDKPNSPRYKRCLPCKAEAAAERNRRARDTRAAARSADTGANAPERRLTKRKQESTERGLYQPLTEFTPEEIRTVRLHACARATDLDEARMFIDMLTAPSLATTGPGELYS